MWPGSRVTRLTGSPSPTPYRRDSTRTPPFTNQRVRTSRSTSAPSWTHTAEQPWWLGYLDTGAHDVVFNTVPKVTLYWGWRYVLVEAGPEQALTWRSGHMRGGVLGGLPDLFFPADRTWLASALWDDTWTDFGGSAELVDALQRDPIANARQVQPDQDAVPPGLTRE